MRTAYGFRRKIVFPALLIVAVLVGMVALVLDRMAAEVNRADRDAAGQSVRVVLDLILDRLGSVASDLTDGDPASVAGRLAAPGLDLSAFDIAAVLGAEGETTAVRTTGRPFAAFDRNLLGSAMAPLLARSGAANRRGVGVVATSSGPAAVVLHRFGFDEAGRGRFLLLVTLLDDTRLAPVGAVLGLQNVAVVGADAEGYPLIDPNGRRIGTLTWAPRNPGAVALHVLLPGFIAMALLLGSAILFLLVSARRLLTKVETSEREARWTAEHDALTGLPNRICLREAIDTRPVARPGITGHALLYLDLDGFKEVNDTYGHETGDELLRMVAEALQELAQAQSQGGGAGNLVARIAGDEFALLLQAVDPDAAGRDMAQRIIRLLAEPFQLGGRIVSVGASIGIAAVCEGRVAAEELLRRADVAMYRAKEQGRNQAAVHGPEMDAERQARAVIAEELAAAIEFGELQLVYQPIFDTGSRALVGVEALLRWPRPGREPIGPDVFIPIAEAKGLISRLGAFVLTRACLDGRRWPDLTMSVNVSPAQFRNPHFEETIATILRETDLPHGQLQLEMTETYLVADPDRARAAIQAVRALGVRVALDDFGTGFSSLGYLRQFQFDTLKLDRSVVDGIARDPSAQKLALATVALADALGLDVTAEGVETEDDALVLRIAGCRSLQGYLLGKPSPAAVIDGMVAEKGREPEPALAIAGLA